MHRLIASALLPAVFAALLASASASQIQAFKNTPARPATAAAQIAAQQAAREPAERVEHAEHSEHGEHNESPEARTEHALNEAKGNQGALYAFLREMPKGGDLHNHLSGGVYAEELLNWAVHSQTCLDRRTLAIVSHTPCSEGQTEVSQVLTDAELYARVIDAWSMRKATRGESGHDHFFATFGHYSLVSEEHQPEMLEAETQRAADGNVQYLELMLTPDHGRAAALGKQLGWDANFATMRQRLMAGGLEDIVTESRKQLDTMETARNTAQRCGTPAAVRGCAVRVRYIYQVSRANSPAQVFAQMVLGFELASHDPRVVALTLVQPEDSYLALRDFHLHMQMLGYLKEIYPSIHLTLHAGELRPGMVPPAELRDHIRESVELAHAERIGHGVDVMYEDNPHELLSVMAHRNVLVEICLSSNEDTLNVAGHRHPLSLYLKAGVPVALATDDEGVARTEMTEEFVKAVSEQGVDYATLKRMVRNSLEHSFLPGFSLWSDTRRFTAVHECAGERPGTTQLSAACGRFLNSNEKAHEQWRLEHKLTEFESRY